VNGKRAPARNARPGGGGGGWGLSGDVDSAADEVDPYAAAVEAAASATLTATSDHQGGWFDGSPRAGQGARDAQDAGAGAGTQASGVPTASASTAKRSETNEASSMPEHVMRLLGLAPDPAIAHAAPAAVASGGDAAGGGSSRSGTAHESEENEDESSGGAGSGRKHKEKEKEKEKRKRGGKGEDERSGNAEVGGGRRVPQIQELVQEGVYRKDTWMPKPPAMVLNEYCTMMGWPAAEFVHVPKPGESIYDSKTLVVIVDGKQLGSGFGENKAAAKNDAAVKSLIMLDPSLPETGDLNKATVERFEGDARFSDMLLRIWMVNDRVGQLPAFDFDRFSDGSYCAQGRFVMDTATLSAVGKGASKAEAKQDASKLLLCKLFQEAEGPEAALETAAAVVDTLSAASKAAREQQQQQQQQAAERGEGEEGAGAEAAGAAGVGVRAGPAGYGYANSHFESAQAQSQQGLGPAHMGGIGGVGGVGATETDTSVQHYAGYIDPNGFDPNNFDAGLGLRASAPVFYTPTSGANVVAFGGASAAMAMSQAQSAMAMSQAQAMVPPMVVSTAVPSNSPAGYGAVQPPPPPPGPPPPLGHAPPYTVPPNYLCPLSGRLMTRPVIADDGWAYDEAALTQWVQTAVATKQVPYSPFNGADLSQTQMRLDFVLQAEIERWYAVNAQYSHAVAYQAGFQ